MILKTGTSLAFAAACLTAIGTLPVNAQTAGSYGTAPGATAPQTYQGNTSPNWSNSGNYAPQAYQNNTSPNWSNGATQGNMQPSSAGMGNTEVITNGPQGSPPANWSARQNVIQSEHYDRLLETNRGFRQARMRKECGPITDPELRQQCFASFRQDEPYTGSSSPRRSYNSSNGR
jgi:hypothetical protein